MRNYIFLGSVGREANRQLVKDRWLSSLEVDAKEMSLPHGKMGANREAKKSRE
jgi:hypothetical protein